MPSPSLDARLARLYNWHPLRFDSGLDPKLLVFSAHAARLDRYRPGDELRFEDDPDNELRPVYDFLRRVSLGEVAHESAVREWLEAAAIARRRSAVALAALGARRDPSHPRPGQHNGVARYLVGLIATQYPKPKRAAVLAQLAEIFDDLFGDFEAVPTPFHPEWRTAEVLGLACAARAGARGVLPLLADALEEAGCDDADLLTHCRGAGPHFVGCRALDRVQFDWDELFRVPAPPSAG